MQMKVLIVYTHPNPKSFNHAILESFTAGLKEAGHTYEVSDLYAQGFDPCLKGPDFAQFTGGQMPADVVKEQQKVTAADALVFIHPVWWWMPPAMTKGWYDRVLSAGFAYGISEQGQPMGLLKNIQKVLLISTTMGQEDAYKGMRIEEAMKATDAATFTMMCGIPDVEQVLLFAAATDADARQGHLEKARQLGKGF
jgi:NAD(P)H dehydrogenase (quinone)